MVTHDQAEAMTLADRIVVMNDRDPAGRPADGDLQPAGQHLRRALRRLAGDDAGAGELVAGRGASPACGSATARRSRRACRATACRARRRQLGLRPEASPSRAGGGTTAPRSSWSSGSATAPWSTRGCPTAGDHGEDEGNSRSRWATDRPQDRRRARASVRPDGAGHHAEARRMKRRGAAAGAGCSSSCRSCSLYLVILIYPLLRGMALSFQRVDLFGGGHLRRARQLRAAVRRPGRSIQSVLNTFALALMIVPLLTVLALALALALNRATRGAAIFRGIFFSSSVLSVTIVTLIWRFVLAPDAGLLGEAAQAMGPSRSRSSATRPGRSGRWRSPPSGGRSACR
jgi:hypothetical protein